MPFHGLLVIRDEADIISQTLTHLLTWADGIYILDTGSTDGTWDIVNDIASREKRIVPMMTTPAYWSLGLRAMLFDKYRPRFRRGDWIARLDADEFYHISPPEFVSTHVEKHEGRIRVQMFEFVLTRSMVNAWEQKAESTTDRARPISDRRRIYYIDPHPEVRLFRYRPSMKWPATRAVPWNDGLTAFERIPIRHYRCRDPLQVQARCFLRSRMRRGQATTTPDGIPITHWAVDDWNYWVWADDNPRLRTWAPGTDLPIAKSPRLARGTLPYLSRRAFYASGLAPLIDRFKPGYDPSFKPDPIPDSLQQEFASWWHASPRRAQGSSIEPTAER